MRRRKIKEILKMLDTILRNKDILITGAETVSNLSSDGIVITTEKARMTRRVFLGDCSLESDDVIVTDVDVHKGRIGMDILDVSVVADTLDNLSVEEIVVALDNKISHMHRFDFD